MPDELHTNSTECETDDLSFVISVLGAEKAHKHLTKDGFTVHELAEAARSIIARGESLEAPALLIVPFPTMGLGQEGVAPLREGEGG